ncbi:MAG: ATP-binding cassette domain-containing protein [Clostridiales bacterium]|nr:ATP-binding cassette domain-containing protein [Clostridiales bacterium]
MLIQAFDLCKRYDNGIVALDGITLSIKKGEFVFLTGQSGAGKSTLIRLFFREELPSSGRLLLSGRSIERLSERERVILRRNTGVVFQDFRLLERGTVFENVAFAMKAAERPWQEIRNRVPEIVARVGLSGRENEPVTRLSGGEQQRVAVARALVNDPMVLLADEPTGDLDPDTAGDLMRLFAEINDAGTTVVVATHDRDMVNEMNRRVVTLRGGQMISDRVGGWMI